MATTRAIDLKTEVPGPRSREILDRKARVIAEPLSIYLPIVIEEAHGATITDVDGNTFIDFTGGVGCLNVGHSNPRVVEAAKEQIERFTHTDFTIVPYENYIALAERLVELVPIGGEKRAAFFNSGAEAVENAVKFARSYTRRPAVIAFDGGFHGRTLLALSLTSKTHPYKAGLGPFAPEVYRVAFDDLEELQKAFKTRIAAEEVAAIVFEPVQGESGFIVPSQEFVEGVARDLRRERDRHGRGRGSDRLLPHRQGLRHGALRRRARPDDDRQVDRGRNPAFRCDRAGAHHGRARRQRRRRHLRRQPGGHRRGTRRPRHHRGGPPRGPRGRGRRDDSFADGVLVRALRLGCRGPGLGAMLAIELRQNGEPAADLATAVAEAAARRGLLILKAGIHGNCIRVLVPLVIGDSELDEALGAWEEALEEASA